MSVVEQDFDEPIECVIADNNSTDETSVIVKNIVSRNPQIAWTYLPSDRLLPITTNWRRAVEASQGDFTKILWDDDWMHPLCLRRLVTLAVRNDASIVTCNSITVDETGCVADVEYHNPAGAVTFDQWLDSAFNGRRVLYSPTAALLRRKNAVAGLETAERLGDCASRGIGPDVIMLYFGGALGEKIWHSSERLVYMWAGTDSISVSTNSSQLAHCYRRALLLLVELNTGHTPVPVFKRSNHWLARDRQFAQTLNTLELRSEFSVRIFGADVVRRARLALALLVSRIGL